jgi:hypothetical protein
VVGTDTIATMQSTTLAMSLARSRMAIGLAAVVAPGRAAGVMAGRKASDPIAPLFARMLGARDVALGLGTVIALDRGKPVRGWLEGSALSDTADCLACVIAREHIPANVLRVAVGAGASAAVIGVLLSRRLDPPPPPRPGQPEAVATGHPDPA